MALPTHCGMPPLNLNIEGLRKHAMLVTLFVSESDVSIEKRKWRSWLVHCLVKTARHYNEARSLILAQINEGKRPPAVEKGRQLHMFIFRSQWKIASRHLKKRWHASEPWPGGSAIGICPRIE